MNGAIGLLETHGLTPAMVAIDGMLKTAAVSALQVELNDLYGVCVKVTGPVADVETALRRGLEIACQMQGRPIATVLTRPAQAAFLGIRSRDEFNPLIQQGVVFESDSPSLAVSDSPIPRFSDSPFLSATSAAPASTATFTTMNETNPQALGFIETQGFTAVFEAIDTACKAADVEVVAKEKLGGGYITVIVQGDLSAVTAAVAAGREKVAGLGKLIAAHVIARPNSAVLKLLPKL